MQHFPPPRELNWGPYPPYWLLTQGLGSTGFLLRPPNGGCFLYGSIFNRGCFLCGSLFNGGLAEAGWALPEMVVSSWYSRNPSSGTTLTQDSIIREGDVRLCYFSQLQDAPHQKAWLAWGRQVGLLHPELECLHIGHCFLQLCLPDILAGELCIWQMGGNPSGRDMGVLGEPGGNSPHHAACLSTGGAQKRPVSSGPAPSSHPLLESLPTPATSQTYEVPVPARLPIFHIPLLGVLGRNHFCYLPLHSWLAPGECG